MIRRLYFSLLIVTIFSFGSSYFIQTVRAQATPPDVIVDISPEHPGPYESVTISLTSYSIDIASANIAWTLDGTPKSNAIGNTTFSFTTKNAGISTTIQATITTVDGGQTTKTITITPMGVDLLWEAVDSVVPPLYRGKALPGSESTIKFVAVPNIVSGKSGLVAATNLLYTWKRNFETDQTQSGYGKNYFTVRNEYLSRSEQVNVQVSQRGGDINAEKNIIVTTIDPKIVWYGESPLYGPQFNSAVGTDYTISGSEAAVIAEPYFFSPNDPTSKKLTYSWTLNGDQVSATNDPNKLYLHRDNTTPGDASVAVTVKNISKLFQEASASLQLHLQ